MYFVIERGSKQIKEKVQNDPTNLGTLLIKCSGGKATTPGYVLVQATWCNETIVIFELYLPNKYGKLDLDCADATYIPILCDRREPLIVSGNITRREAMEIFSVAEWYVYYKLGKQHNYFPVLVEWWHSHLPIGKDLLLRICA